MRGVKTVRFSRPLLLVSSMYQNKNYYQTIYGFVIPEHLDLDDTGNQEKLEQYVGYLCSHSCWANGDNFFTFTTEERGIPDFVEKRTGKVHQKMDPWLIRMGKKCMKKLNLSYDIITGDIDEEDYSIYVNDFMFIVDNWFFFELEEPDDETPSPEEPSLWDDGLPF